MLLCLSIGVSNLWASGNIFGSGCTRSFCLSRKEKRQLAGWVKIVDNLGDCIAVRTAKQLQDAGCKVSYVLYDTGLYEWFCAWIIYFISAGGL